MYKVIWLAKFRHDLSHEEVLRWWRGHHAELAMETPGMLRYVQNYWTDGLDAETHRRSGKPAYDGHAEHWFADKESYDAAMESRAWKLNLEDGPNGFEQSLVGGALEETVICWDPMDDGRASG